MSATTASGATAGNPGVSPPPRQAAPLLFEIAWEVCNQIGGIYQVIRSKVPTMERQWGERYVLVGPDNTPSSTIEFEEQARIPSTFEPALVALRQRGVRARFGRWLISGRPQVILVGNDLSADELGVAKYHLWADHGIATPAYDPLIDGVVRFGLGVHQLLAVLAEHSGPRPIVAHFHEWLGGLAIPLARRDRLPIGLVFTTHATLLGRYLAADRADFYDAMPTLDHAAEAERYRVTPIHTIERACAHGAHVFTTVSDVTGEECRYLLGRGPDVLLPNGLNIRRFVAAHHFQKLHVDGKEMIHRFVRGHFFPYYQFDLDKTLYFFTSGRFEPRNKGFDLCLESMARLNAELKSSGLDLTVVFFVITRRDGVRISSECLNNRAVLSELYDTCQAITAQVGTQLFDQVSSGKAPPTRVADLVDEYWLLRLRRTLHAWRRDGVPPVVTHEVFDGDRDPVLNAIHGLWIANGPHDPVKVVYHPEFVTSANPLWKVDYDQFVRGCHLGIFPSAYEPWGYTPMESLASGVPAVASDLSGFGRYVERNCPDHDDWGAYVVRRHGTAYPDSAADLTRILLRFCHLNRRERIALRNRTDDRAAQFDWSIMAAAYQEAHERALAALRGDDGILARPAGGHER